MRLRLASLGLCLVATACYTGPGEADDLSGGTSLPGLDDDGTHP